MRPVSLPLVEGGRVNDGVAAAVYRGALLGVEPDLLRDALRRPILGVDDRDQPGRAEHVAGEVTRGGRRLGGVAEALQRGSHVVADLQLGHAIYQLRGEAAIADESVVGRAQ